MSMEDLEVENLNRYEKLLTEKHGELPKGLENNINKMRKDLMIYEIGGRVLTRVSDVLYDALEEEDIKVVEQNIKYLADTFWNRVEDF